MITWGFFVTLNGRGSVSEQQVAVVRAWLGQHAEIAGFEVGPLVDAWHADATPARQSIAEVQAPARSLTRIP